MTEHERDSAGSQEAGAFESTSLTRRRFLAGGAAAVGGLALGGDALARVLIRERPAAQAAPAATKVKRGGTLTIGSIGSTVDTMDPNKNNSNMDLQREFNFYDSLTYFPA